MIKGVGVDLVSIERLTEAVKRWDARFLERVYTERERKYCFGKRNPYLSLAVRFAAKEALIKAVGREFPVSFRDVEITNNPSGRPFINARGALKDNFDRNGIHSAHLSLSHEREYGVACVVLEG